MSATVPDNAAEAQADRLPPAGGLPWPRLTLRAGGSVLEWRGPTLFVRLFGFEAYVCTAEVSDWWTLREPGCFECAMAWVRVSVSRATPTHDC